MIKYNYFFTLIINIEGLLHKLRFIPTPSFFTLKSFILQRIFAVRCDDEISTIHQISASIPQGSILASTLYNIITSNIPHSCDTHLAIFADISAILFSNPDSNYINKTLRDYLDQLQNCFKLWRIKIKAKKNQPT